MPGSAMKGSLIRSAGNTEMIQQVTKTAQLKEDLYADLTGLIVRGVKQESEEDVYDCLQTGRDGRSTLPSIPQLFRSAVILTIRQRYISSCPYATTLHQITMKKLSIHTDLYWTKAATES